MNIFPQMLLAALLLGATPLLAQQRPPARALTESDQELDGFGGRYAGIHKLSGRLRGVRGADSTLYWVSADGRWLVAAQRGRQLWRANLAQAFAAVLPRAVIGRLVLSAGVIFVFTDGGGHAEVNRATGKVAAVGVDKN